MIVLDTSGLLAWIDAAQRRHPEVKQVMESVAGPFLLSPFILAELDYLLATRVGSEAQEALLEEVGQGTYRLEDFEAVDVREALKILRRYSDFGIGLADASLVVLAERHLCDTILTLDERHFRVLQVQGRPFRLLPSDA